MLDLYKYKNNSFVTHSKTTVSISLNLFFIPTEKTEDT
jgi:hypothetical protein